MKLKLTLVQISKAIATALALLLFISISAQKQSTPQKTWVVKNVNVIPMTVPNTILYNATVTITGNRIIAINDTFPKNAKIINGKGKWLMPGLIDMHVHIPADGVPFGPKLPTQGATLFFDLQDYMLLNVANGVTTVFELSAKAEHFGQRNEIGKGAVIGPRMALASTLDGGKGQGQRVNTPEDGRQAVRSVKAEGYEFIKVYAYLNIETYKAIVDEANKQGLKVVGHIPNAFKGKLKEAFVKGFGMVAHAEELTNYAVNYSEAEAKQMAELLKENGTWLSPTLTTMERILGQVKSLDEVKKLPSLKYVHPLLQSKWLTANKYNKMSSPEDIAHFEKYTKFNLLLVKACKEAGVPIVTGTDAGTSAVVAGFAMHDELELLVKAGLTPEEVLVSATRLPATWLGIESKVGTIEINKLADFILLDENPLINIKNAQKISAVCVNGNWIEKKKINTMLANLAKRNTQSKDKFDWKTTISKKAE